TLRTHIEKLSKSSDDMASISNKMSKMSQDQAAAMEEASAALEENMDNMDKMTAEAAVSYEAANKVNNLMTSTAESARLGEQDLTKMVSEMQNIKDSTSKIADIIKIIS